MLALPDSGFFVATVHAHNTSPKRTHMPGWNGVPEHIVARLIGEQFETYCGHLKAANTMSANL
jgi:hypothetical protein